MTVDDLINQTQELKSVAYNSPKIDLWKNRVKKFINENYGSDNLEIFINTTRVSVVSFYRDQNQNYFEERLDGVIEFLEELKKEEAKPKTQILLPEVSKQSPVNRSSPKPAIYNINNAQFGDYNTINNITIGEFIGKIQKEIEDKVPDSPERKGILESLTKITNNPLFSSVTGSIVGEIAKKIITGS